MSIETAPIMGPLQLRDGLRALVDVYPKGDVQGGCEALLHDGLLVQPVTGCGNRG